MENNTHVSIEELQSLQRFGDLLEEASRNLQSDLYHAEPNRNAPDAIGFHWYGERLNVHSRLTGIDFYLHTGIIYLPETKVGFMVEVDKKNNVPSYDRLREKLIGTDDFEVTKVEPDYLKLFMKEAEFSKLCGSDTETQASMIKKFLDDALCAIVKTEALYSFRITSETLSNIYSLAGLLRDAVDNAEGEDYVIAVNKADPDNFGQYSMGYRLWLNSRKSSTRMYAYFGIIYSYKKSPAGVFAEIDEPSNKDCFARVKKNLVVPADIERSDQAPSFIKLFMPQEKVQKLNQSDLSVQKKMLKAFLEECCQLLVDSSNK